MKISLAGCFNSLLHQPRTNTGYALYTRVANADSNDDYNDSIRKAEKDPTYIQKSQIIYNSPENIRRIFLTGKGAAVHYYYAPKLNGKESRSASYHAMKIDGECSNLLEVADKIANYNMACNQYRMQLAITKDAKKPVQYDVTGNFNFVTYPYTMNNIEEIYFDWTLLLSADILPYMANVIGVRTPMELAMKMITSNGVTCQGCSQLMDVFVQANMGGTKNIEKRFPRLKKIAMISNLADLDAESFLLNNQLEKTITNTTWLDEHKNELMSTGKSLILEYDVRREFTTEFIVKTSTYKYDAEILEPKVKTFKAAIEDLRRQQKYGANTEVKTQEDIPEPVEESAIENKLIELSNILPKLDENVLKFTYMYGTATKEDWKDILRGFSKANRHKYASIINIEM